MLWWLILCYCAVYLLPVSVKKFGGMEKGFYFCVPLAEKV